MVTRHWTKTLRAYLADRKRKYSWIRYERSHPTDTRTLELMRKFAGFDPSEFSMPLPPTDIEIGVFLDELKGDK